MAKNLVIVESPAKAKTISSFLGSDYEIKSSYGHIRDLPKKGLGVDIDKQFLPTYEISPDKKKVVAELKRAAKNKTVWLASDEDREGEAIAWHISNILDLDPTKTKRIVFHEITKPAIQAAISSPRIIDMQLVDSQQARRILDRLVGYELSPVLWKKVRTGLSAGRVQSVAVRLIVEREREIKNYTIKTEFKITADFRVQKHQIEADLPLKFTDELSATKFLEDIKNANYNVASVEKKPGNRSPGPPFITSTLQQEAARRLGYSVRQTMTLAQRLYENGHITYMRTDSTNLSPLAIDAAAKYLNSQFGRQYLDSRQYKTKNTSAQEAHEAIRPTSFSRTAAGDDSSQKKLYQLIWQRALASQMAVAKVEKTQIDINISTRPEKFQASGEVLVFDGFLKVYGGGKEDKVLPPLIKGQALQLYTATATQNYSRAAARYSEASLVRKLEELGIGRPSTYAPTIGTIQDRGYIEKGNVEGHSVKGRVLQLKAGKIAKTDQELTIGADHNKLLPTFLADIVTDFLTKHFSSIIDYTFTARAEAEFDDIAEGKIKWQESINKFYKQFHPLVRQSEKADRSEAAKARQLGIDPVSGKIVVVRYGRFGPVLQLGEAGDEVAKDAPKPIFASLPEGSNLEDITLEQALPMFKLPRQVGKTAAGDIITANIGRFGPYVQAAKLYASIKGYDPMTITELEARSFINEKIAAEQKKVIADFGKLRILNGPYGPYVTDGQKNARIPKEVKPKKLTAEQAGKILEAGPPKRARRFIKKSNAKS